MSTRWHIHVIDPDFRRRAQIAYELAGHNLHAEIYENLEEFGARIPADGAILIADESAECSPAALRPLLEAAKAPLPMAAYSNEPLPQKIVAAMLEGAVDYLRWPFNASLLKAAVDRLADVGARKAKQQRRQAEAKAVVDDLSDRELEVLELMMVGHSNKEIGEALGISPRTVEIHRGNMMRKLNARSPSEAVRVAMIAGLDGVEDDDGHRLAA